MISYLDSKKYFIISLYFFTLLTVGLFTFPDYGISIDEDNFWVEITHTLTSAFCPFAEEIVADITKAGYVPEVLTVNVITTFDPPFTIDSVSDETKLMMGW